MKFYLKNEMNYYSNESLRISLDLSNIFLIFSKVSGIKIEIFFKE